MADEAALPQQAHGRRVSAQASPRAWPGLLPGVALLAIGLTLALWLWRNPAGEPTAATGARPAPASALRTRAVQTPPAAPLHASRGARAASDDLTGWDASLRAHWRRVVEDGDPRQRLIALSFLVTGLADPAERRWAAAIAAAALAEAPDDPLVAQMQGWFCREAAGECTPAQREAWLRLEPGNAAAWADAIAGAAKDPSRTDELLAQAARGDRYDSRQHALMLEAVAAMDDAPIPRLDDRGRAMLADMGLPPTDAAHRRALAAHAAMAQPMPNILAISRACRPPVNPWRARDCRTMLGRMAGAGTIYERAIAYSLLARLTAGSAEGVHWAAQDRRLRWWMQQYAHVALDEIYWNDFLRHGELEALRRAIARARRPLDPPPGWTTPGR